MSAKVVFLILTIVTGPDKPNKEATVQAPSIEECAMKGLDFITQEPRDLGGVALAFACVTGYPPGEPV